MKRLPCYVIYRYSAKAESKIRLAMIRRRKFTKVEWWFENTFYCRYNNGVACMSNKTSSVVASKALERALA